MDVWKVGGSAMSGLRGPVALLSLWTRNDFLDKLGEPAYQAEVLGDSLAAAAGAGGSRPLGGSFDPGNHLADDATLDELPSTAQAAAAAQCLQALEDLAPIQCHMSRIMGITHGPARRLWLHATPMRLDRWGLAPRSSSPQSPTRGRGAGQPGRGPDHWAAAARVAGRAACG